MTVRNIENISATNMRVNLTDIIGGLTVEDIVAVTKHGKVIAYMISPETYEDFAGIEPESVADGPLSEEPAEPQDVSEVVDNDDLDDYLEEDSLDDTPSESSTAEIIEFRQLDDDEELEEDDDFEHYLAQLRRQTMGFINSDNI